jgi:hypothetical protein
MTVTGARTRSVDQWHSVLTQLDQTLQSSLANLDAQDEWLGDDDEFDSTGELEIEAKLDQRIRQISARVAEAEESAALVSAELAAAEDDLRKWVEQVGAIAKQIDVISH